MENSNKKKEWTLRDQIDRLKFKHIFLIWVSAIFFFGLIYHFSINSEAFLLYSKEGVHVSGIKDAIYFSFVTATTTGFGDIIPVGYFKTVAVIEVIFGLLLLAIVTSKLISIKQDVILSELYEFSLNEKISKVRSSLLLFRQHLDRLMVKGEEGNLSKRDANEVNSQATAFEQALTEAYALIVRPSSSHFIRNIDPINTELIFNSILLSFEKLNETLNLFEQKNIDWKSESTLNHMKKCINLTETLFTKIDITSIIPEETLLIINNRKNKILPAVKDKIEKK
ncbi:two pore domain potassium channel family protein [Candidatus Woesearchaeota archaeon]|nr:two pore domain potassium channel family protein [Candidatus Woesearchaeota archaeon]